MIWPPYPSYSISLYFPHLTYRKAAPYLIWYSDMLLKKIYIKNINWTVAVISVSLIWSTIDNMELDENISQKFE